MPEICRFFGIIIAIFYDDHNPPHFHARYGSQKVAIDIVMKWAALHKDELLTDWELAKTSQVPHKIEPLK